MITCVHVSASYNSVWDTDEFLRLARPEEYAEVDRIAVSEGFDSMKIDPITFYRLLGQTFNLNEVLSTS
jgi:hypothetical protein